MKERTRDDEKKLGRERKEREKERTSERKSERKSERTRAT